MWFPVVALHTSTAQNRKWKTRIKEFTRGWVTLDVSHRLFKQRQRRLQRNVTIKISASFHRHLILKGKLKGTNSSSDLHSSSQLSHVVSNWLQHCSYEHSCPPSRVSAPLQKKKRCWFRIQTKAFQNFASEIFNFQESAY